MPFLLAGYREAAEFSSYVMNVDYGDKGFMLGLLSRAVEGQGTCILIERIDGSYVLNSSLEDLYLVGFDRENRARMDVRAGGAKTSLARLHSRGIGHVHAARSDEIRGRWPYPVMDV